MRTKVSVLCQVYIATFNLVVTLNNVFVYATVETFTLAYMQVLFTHRIAWEITSAPCNASIVSSGVLIGEAGVITCRAGCSGSLGSVQFQCTDFNIEEGWSAGQGSNEVNLTSVVTFEAS